MITFHINTNLLIIRFTMSQRSSVALQDDTVPLKVYVADIACNASKLHCQEQVLFPWAKNFTHLVASIPMYYRVVPGFRSRLLWFLFVLFTLPCGEKATKRDEQFILIHVLTIQNSCQFQTMLSRLVYAFLCMFCAIGRIVCLCVENPTKFEYQTFLGSDFY